MNGNVDIQSVYDMLPFIPVPKETYEAMCFQNEQLRKEVKKLKDINKPFDAYMGEFCGNCSHRIAKKAKFCSECGAKIYRREDKR